MQNFANQCLDIARSILGHNLGSINEDGTVDAVPGEEMFPEEGAHALAAIGEYYRATGDLELEGFDIVDLAARCLTYQTVQEKPSEMELAYSALGLLAFGPAKDRNLLWERLVEETRNKLDEHLLFRSDASGKRQAFNIAKAVARYSMGLTKKDDTGKLIDRFLKRIDENSSTGYFSDFSKNGIGGIFDTTGLMSFIFIRQALQLHVNIHLRERKLPSLRTYAQKYVRLINDIVREDGLGLSYGTFGVGVYGQIYCISMILQALRDGWISEDKKEQYLDILLKLFHFFFVSYIDQEHGFLVVKDEERASLPGHTTRRVSFDAARYLCQWARLAKSIGGVLNVSPAKRKTVGRFVCFDKSYKKEQGLFTYQNADTGLLVQLPLVSGAAENISDSLAFPHCSGIFDWPVNTYLPILLPELTLNEVQTVPSFYGKNCVAGLGLRRSYYFSYEQPELISVREKVVPGLGSCKVKWTFLNDGKIQSEFTYKFEEKIRLDRFRYVIPVSLPHSFYRSDNTFCLGNEGIRATVDKDDFHTDWQAPEIVQDDPNYKTYYGKIHYLQILQNKRILNLQAGKEYRFQITLEPDINRVSA